MVKISNDMIKLSYELGKKFFNKKMKLKECVDELSKKGMNKNSATDYIYNYSNLIQGKLFTRTTNAFATDYYLRKIHEDEGSKGLGNALLSLSLHIDYYEDKSGVEVKERRKIYIKYNKLVQDVEYNVVYPDELDSVIKYSEGKTKKILVNSYERNPHARKKCIDHYGLNCQVCDFNFYEKYGDIGKDFIHVHHIIDISTVGKEYDVDPINDLIPVCPNCHSMLHKKKPALSIQELKKKLQII
jgi:5-methylcytosine-specific restriction enzyme A